MQTELEKLDAICSRMNVSYDAARTALAEADGDVIQAIVNLESREGDLLSAGIELLDDVQKLLQSKSIKKLRIKFDNKPVAEFPVAYTAAAAVAVGIAALIISKSSIEVEQEEIVVEGQENEQG